MTIPSSNSELSSQRLRVLVATPLGHHGRGGIDRINDAIFDEINSQPDINVRVTRLVTRGKGGLLAAQFIFSYAIARLCFAALRKDVDLLHIHLSDRGSAYRKVTLAAFARLLRIPYVVHLHGAIFLDFWTTSPKYVAQSINKLFSESNQIIALGQFWANGISERVAIASDRICVLPNATASVRTPKVSSCNEQIRITCLGQLGPRKGTEQLIEALQLLRKRSDWTATIAGNGEVEKYRTLVQSLGLQERVCIPGWLEPGETSDLLRRTDILVLPSFAENLPMAILEAFAHGIPVVSTPVGAIPEVVHPGRNGILVPPGDVPALSLALEELIEHRELRQHLGSQARNDHAKHYEITRYVARLAEIWMKAERLTRELHIDQTQKAEWMKHDKP